jgi:signal transduction histidine kinase
MNRMLGQPQILETVVGRLISAQDDERWRIGCELHDRVSQTLGVLLLELDQLRTNPEVTPSIGRALTELRACATHAVADVHHLSHRLHSSTLDYLGLVPALEKLVAEFSSRHAIPTELSASLRSVLRPDVAHTLFRVVEESLANIARHSHASSARVHLRDTSDGLQLTVQDDGDGFAAGRLDGKAGLGLVQMRERLRLVRGTLRVTSMRSRGTTITVRVPRTSLGLAAAGATRTADPLHAKRSLIAATAGTRISVPAVAAR